MEVKQGYKQTEVGVIPEEWLVPCLGDCGEVIMGQSPPGSSYNRTGMGIPLINGPTEFTDRHPIKIQWTTQPSRFCKAGDLLICVRGSSTGRTNYANDTYAIGRGVAAIRAKYQNDTEYLSYQVISGVSDILAAATGSTFPSVDGASFRKLIVPLPSPHEQRAIADALSDADTLIESLEQLLAKKRNVKHGAMQELLTGQHRLPGFSHKWEVRSLGEGISLLSGHHVLAQYCNSSGDGVPYLTGPADFPDGKIYHTKFTTRPTTMCNSDDILVTVKGSGSGSLVMADGVYCISRQLMAIRVRDWDRRFIYYSLLQNASKINAASTGLIPGLSRSDILEQLLPLPPVPEQTAIAAILSDMDAQIEAIETKLAKTRQIKHGMTQELLTGRIRLV